MIYPLRIVYSFSLTESDGVADHLKWLFRTAEITHLECFGLQVVDGAIRNECVSVPVQSDITSQDNFVRGGIVFGVIAINGDVRVADDYVSLPPPQFRLQIGFVPS